MESWKRKLRMGMIGGGQGAFIGGVHRIAAAMDGQIELVAGCFSRDYENTKKTGEELYLDPSRCYKSYEEMAEKEAKLPEDQRIDFVSIVTPNKMHYAPAKTFLEAGFHVICDKPMTYTLEEAEDLVKVVEKTGRVFCLTHNYTGNSVVRHARKLFASGEMGPVRKVLVQYFQEFLSSPLEKLGDKQASWRVDPSQSGIGGTLGDIGTHCFNLLEYMTADQVSQVCADKTTFTEGRKLDEDVNALLRLKSGGKGVLTISQIAPGEENGLTIRIYGSKGAVVWEQENPNYMYLFKLGEPKQILGRNTGYMSEEANEVARIPSGHPEGYLEAFANTYADAARAVRAYIDGKPMKTEDYKFPTVYDGLRGMKFIYSSVESSDKGAVWVDL